MIAGDCQSAPVVRYGYLMTTRGFTGRQRPPNATGRIPPGQSETHDFPVLSAGPTPHIRTEDWSFTLKVGPKPVKSWTWAEFNALPQTDVTRDIHCVTQWSKLDTAWRGVSIGDVLAAAALPPPTKFTPGHSFHGYSSNMPRPEPLHWEAMVAVRYAAEPRPAAQRGA